MISRILVENFRSIERLQLDFGPLNILIGSNASGKSNIIDAIRLTKEFPANQEHPLVLTEKRGGIENLIFAKSKTRGFSILSEYNPSPEERLAYQIIVSETMLYLRNFGYTYSFTRQNKLERLTLRKPQGSHRVELYASPKTREKVQKEMRKVIKSKTLIKLINSLIELVPEEERKKVVKVDMDKKLEEEIKKSLHKAWLDAVVINNLSKIKMIALNLKAAREATWIKKERELDEDGKNISSVINSFSKSQVENLLEKLISLLEFVEKIGVETKKEKGKAYIIVKESFFTKDFDPRFISDGTLRLILLLVALETLPKNGTLCMEDVEVGLHPLIFPPLLDIIRSYCEKDNKQVILTTHNPEVVSAAKPKEIIIVARNEEGATVAKKLSDDTFEKWLDDYKLGELWLMRYLGGVPGESDSDS